MKRTDAIRKTIAGAVLLVMLSACALDPTRLALPGSHANTNTYSVKIEFSSVLSLTPRAKVAANGVQVGVLDTVKLVKNTAVAVVDIDSAVKLPQNTHARLQQTTLFSDIYIDLSIPDDPSPTQLRGGDTIPLKNTTPPDNFEELLRSTASLVTGSDLTTVSDALSSFHKVFARNPEEVAQLQRQLAGALRDIAANQAVLDQFVANTDAISASAMANARIMGDLESRLPGLLELARNTVHQITFLLVSIGGAIRSLTPVLGPSLPGLAQSALSLTPLIAAISTADTNLSVLVNRGFGLLRDAIVTYFWHDGGPRLTVNAVNIPDEALVLGGENPQDRADEAIQALQTMGLLPQ